MVKNSNEVTIHNLAVIDVLGRELNDSVRHWRRDKNIPKAESCARQVWYGSKDDLSEFPFNKIDSTSLTYRVGEDAYEYMLRLALGMRSKKFSESNITGQFFNGWRNLHRDYPQEAQRYDKLMQYFTADSRLIRGRILSNYKALIHERIAIDLSGLVNGESVLIIGEEGGAGSKYGLSPFTEGVARVASSKSNRKSREVSICHPDVSTGKKMLSGLREIKKKNIICGSVNYVSMDELPLAFEVYDRVIITYPMGKDESVDQQIISAWQGRQTSDNTLTHLCGINGMINELWEKSNLIDFISTNEIWAEMTKRKATNAEIVNNANNAIYECVNMRAEGRQPSHHQLVQRIPTLKNI